MKHRTFLQLSVITLCALVSFMPVKSVYAFEKCYDIDTFRAEQFLRYKEQLMVTAMLCPKFSQHDLNRDIQGFFDRNSQFIRRQEFRVKEHLRREGSNNPERALMTVKTQIANELSERVSDYAPDRYCRVMIPHLREAQSFDASDLKARLAMINEHTRLSTRHLCGKDHLSQINSLN